VIIKQATLLRANTLRTLDIRIEGEIFAEIGENLSDSANTNQIDASGLLALPGAVDPHVHFNDPGYTQHEDFYHGACAAAAGGITTIIDMPCTSIPPVTNNENLQRKLREISGKGIVDYGLFGGISGQSFESGMAEAMEELSDWVLGFKCYFISGMPAFSRLNHYQFCRVLNKAKELGLPVLLHAEDYDYVTGATDKAEKAGSAPVDYYRSRPEIAEILAVAAAVELAERAEADLHIVHVGTAEAAERLRAISNSNETAGGNVETGNREIAGSGAVAESGISHGLPRITCETAPHYLAFDLEDFSRIGAALKTTPPVKSPHNKERLWQLLADGTITFAASDHAPCTPEEKETGSIWTDYPGIPGCSTLLPFLYSEGYREGRLSLKRLVEVTSEKAARRYGLFDRKGSIDAGKDADIVLIDPQQTWKVAGGEFLSKGKITPFEGRTLQGRIVKTIRRGEIIYEDERGITAKPGSGRLIGRLRNG
jgi:dihydroorotase-like cyclic amidohydrolase